MNGSLPKEYHRMRETVANDPPQDPELKGAVDLLFMSVSWLGGPAWSDDHLGQVLAWSMLLGFPEPCTLNKVLHVMVLLASYRFGIRCGCVPDIELMRKHYIPFVKELWTNGKETPWVGALAKRYGFKLCGHWNYREWHPTLDSAGAGEVLDTVRRKIKVLTLRRLERKRPCP